MKKNYLIIMVLLFAVSGVRAQEVSIGVKGGLTIPNITPGGTKTPLSEDYKSRLAWGAGAFADIRFTKTFSLQVGLEYSGQGGQKDGMQALPAAATIAGIMGNIGSAGLTEEMVQMLSGIMPNDKYLYADFKSTAKFNYLMLPVQAKFGWNLSPASPFRFYVSAGVFGSYRLSAKRVSEGVSPFYLKANENYVGLGTYLGGAIDAIPGVPPGTGDYVKGLFDSNVKTKDDTQTITDDIKSFNFGVIGAVGFSYRFCDRHKVFIEGGGNYGLVKIQKSAENGQNRIGCGSVMLGYSFTL